MGEESDEEGVEEPHAGWLGGRVSRRDGQDGKWVCQSGGWEWHFRGVEVGIWER